MEMWHTEGPQCRCTQVRLCWGRFCESKRHAGWRCGIPRGPQCRLRRRREHCWGRRGGCCAWPWPCPVAAPSCVPRPASATSAFAAQIQGPKTCISDHQTTLPLLPGLLPPPLHLQPRFRGPRPVSLITKPHFLCSPACFLHLCTSSQAFRAETSQTVRQVSISSPL